MTRVAGGFVDNQWKRWGRQNCGNEQRSFRCRNQLSKQPLLKTCTVTQFDQWYQPHATWNLTSHTFKSNAFPCLISLSFTASIELKGTRAHWTRELYYLAFLATHPTSVWEESQLGRICTWYALLSVFSPSFVPSKFTSNCWP